MSITDFLREQGFRPTAVDGRWQTPEHWHTQDEGTLQVDDDFASITSDAGVILFAADL